jgi:hypothetical protein
MQIPIVNGIYTDGASDFRTSYPKNFVPVPKSQGVSAGYLRPAEGVEAFAVGVGEDRGGVNWNGVMYRVSGNQLVRVDADSTVTQLGLISGVNTATLDYSFDRLIIAGGGNLYYYDTGTGLTQVTDPDLGPALDALWVDGFTMTTDGTSLVVTELNDPYAVNPLKYGSSEVDPDPVVALLKVRNEVHALNRYTTEAFDNVGGTGFPFQRIDGAQIQRGAVGVQTCCLFVDQLAFMGSGRNEAVSVYVGGGGQSISIASREIDQILSKYTEGQLAVAVVESRVFNAHEHLLIHLNDQTLVYDAAASREMNEPIWFILHSASEYNATSIYCARHFVWCYSAWFSGDPVNARIGKMTSDVASHYGTHISWEFATAILYNSGMGLSIHELELVVLNGRADAGTENIVQTSYSFDGELWSQNKSKTVGMRGDRLKRLVWISQGSMRNIRMQRFQGTSRARLSMARLEARIEPLSV